MKTAFLRCAAIMSLPTTIHLTKDIGVRFDMNSGIDLSNEFYKEPPIVDVFGLPSETKETLYSLDETPVNVDKLTLCCHNNRTHTESTAHVFKDGLNISDCSSLTHFGCIVISVEPVSIRTLSDDQYRYECGAEMGRERDSSVTKSMIQSRIEELLSKYKDHPEITSFFKQSIFIRMIGDIQCDEHWPFLSNDAMEYLHDTFSNVFGINLPSVDRMESPKVPNHRIWFGHAKSTRLITEGLQFGDDINDGLYVLDLQLAPIADTDAVPTRPVIYSCSVVKCAKM